jgi:nitrogen fixation/metabolism regulation signal transduction histidine kinase
MWVSGNRGFGFSGVFVLLIILIVSVFYHLNRISRLFLQFTEALKNRDISTGFSKDLDDPFLSRVASEFTDINRDFGLIRRDKEVQFHLYSSAIDLIQFGLVVFSRQGNILLCNQSFKELVGVLEIKNIKEISSERNRLLEILERVKRGEEEVFELSYSGAKKKMLISCNELILNEEKLKIVSVRDLTRQIDRSELEAWQKLIRVLRHEILNTLSPIRILTSSMSKIVKENVYDEEDKENLKIGMESIHRRAAGLADFAC